MTLSRYSDPEWLQTNAFSALASVAGMLEEDESAGREALIRILEHKDQLKQYRSILSALVQRAGLYPYLQEIEADLTTADLVNLEYHAPAGMDDIVLHSAQAKVYRALMDDVNVILSAPTSFGKSLLIDAVIASGKYSNVVVIVPTIALIDETRRRLSKRFGSQFKIITHPTQTPLEKNIFVLTQERFVEFTESLNPDFFILDEFYKLSPRGDDERTFVLNQAFYQLFKSGAQFFLIGPNVQDITINETDLNFRFFRFDFTTVATEIRYGGDVDELTNALDICRSLSEPTLVYCKSATSAYELGRHLITNGVSAPTEASREMARWLRNAFHPDWDLPRLLDHGIAVHHGSLPRSIAHHILRKFNSGAIRFLLCTSTIIEGVNTSAKNIIIYDNKIATKKFDQFTFNNIKGRAGRMRRHFVGHVYILHPEPDPELPIVDIPSLTQPVDAPESLLIQLDHSDLSERSLEQLRYLHAQNFLPMDVLRSNNGINPYRQVDVAEKIFESLHQYHAQLCWTGVPTSSQLQEACRLIFEGLLPGTPRDNVVSGKQLSFFLFQFYYAGSVEGFVRERLEDTYTEDQTTTQKIENSFRFLRQWCEFNFPRHLTALDRIQRSVFERVGLPPGDYSYFASQVGQLFMHPAATVLEEYGLPHRVTLQVLDHFDLGESVDDIVVRLPKIDVAVLKLDPFEREMLKDTIANL